MEGSKEANEPTIDMMDDEHKPIEPGFVDFAYYGEVIRTGSERAPRDVEEPRLWTLTNDSAARALSHKRTQSAYYDEQIHVGCYAFFDICANPAISEHGCVVDWTTSIAGAGTND
jgi:hypothetical protein